MAAGPGCGVVEVLELVEGLFAVSTGLVVHSFAWLVDAGSGNGHGDSVWMRQKLSFVQRSC